MNKHTAAVDAARLKSWEAGEYAVINSVLNTAIDTAHWGWVRGFFSGHDAAMSRTCEWTPTRNFPPEYSTSCRQKRVDEDSAMRDYCPYCGGKIVPPDSGEEKNDE